MAYVNADIKCNFSGSFPLRTHKGNKAETGKVGQQIYQNSGMAEFSKIPTFAYTHLAFKSGQSNKIKNNICFGSAVNVAKELSYEAFVKFLHEVYPDIAVKNIDEAASKLIKKIIKPDNKGHFGGRNELYHILDSEKFTVRRRIGSNELGGKLQPPDKLLYPELNLGQPIAKIGNDIEVLRKVEGEPIGSPMDVRKEARSSVSSNYVSPVEMLWNEVKFYGQDVSIEKLNKLSQVPQYAFDELAETIKYIRNNGKGHVFDRGDANNIHLFIDKTTGKYKFNILDDLFAIQDHKLFPKERPWDGSVEDMAYAMIRFNGSEIYPGFGFTKFEQEIEKYNKIILEKSILSGLKKGLPLPQDDEEMSILFNLSRIDSSVWKNIRENWNDLKSKVQSGQNIKLFN